MVGFSVATSRPALITDPDVGGNGLFWEIEWIERVRLWRPKQLISRFLFQSDGRARCNGPQHRDRIEQPPPPAPINQLKPAALNHHQDGLLRLHHHDSQLFSFNSVGHPLKHGR